jgi:hypothetical protein
MAVSQHQLSSWDGILCCDAVTCNGLCVDTCRMSPMGCSTTLWEGAHTATAFCHAAMGVVMWCGMVPAVL